MLITDENVALELVNSFVENCSNLAPDVANTILSELSRELLNLYVLADDDKKTAIIYFTGRNARLFEALSHISVEDLEAVAQRAGLTLDEVTVMHDAYSREVQNVYDRIANKPAGESIAVMETMNNRVKAMHKARFGASQESYVPSTLTAAEDFTDEAISKILSDYIAMEHMGIVTGGDYEGVYAARFATLRKLLEYRTLDNLLELLEKHRSSYDKFYEKVMNCADKRDEGVMLSFNTFKNEFKVIGDTCMS